MALLTLVYLPRESSFRGEELKVVGYGAVGVAVAEDGVVRGSSGSVDGVSPASSKHNCTSKKSMVACSMSL